MLETIENPTNDKENVTISNEVLEKIIARIDSLDTNYRRVLEHLQSNVPLTKKSDNLRSNLIHGDCVEVMKKIPAGSVDFILTDPPYLVRYQSRDGRTVLNDDNDHWLYPAFEEMYRVLKDNSFCVSFYGWHKVDTFMQVWRKVGFRPVGHFVFNKGYASSKSFTQAHHESAYLLAKGNPARPSYIPRDVLGWKYTGNKLHPTQKPTEALSELIKAYSKPGDLILDPFAGSGSTAIAAKQNGRGYIAIEKETEYFKIAQKRLTPNP